MTHQRIRQIAISLFAACAVMAATIGGTAGPAAAANPYTAKSLCGSGYSQVGHYPAVTGSNAVWGDLVVMWSAAARKNCVVLLKRVYLGTATQMHARMSVINGGTGTDRGSFRYYAGPVRLPADQECIFIEGSVSNPSGSTVAWASSYAYVHCD